MGYMHMTIELRDVDPEQDQGSEGGFVCEVKRGNVTVLRMPPIKDGRPGSDGETLDFGAVPLVDFMAEYDGCYTPGQALEVFGRALDMILAREGWDVKSESVEECDHDRVKTLPRQPDDGPGPNRWCLECGALLIWRRSDGESGISELKHEWVRPEKRDEHEHLF